ncbi:hypothetical protein ACILE2_11145 [Capnocytophaga canimorsus]|uniref:hypothetical protein n=1 Tax=Capnocytophaga canimorsus TaxID=28188 RepID=UPI0037D3F73B
MKFKLKKVRIWCMLSAVYSLKMYYDDLLGHTPTELSDKLAHLATLERLKALIIRLRNRLEFHRTDWITITFNTSEIQLLYDAVINYPSTNFYESQQIIAIIHQEAIRYI